MESLSRRRFVVRLTALCIALNLSKLHAANVFQRNCCSNGVLDRFLTGVSVSLHPPTGGHYKKTATVKVKSLDDGKTYVLKRDNGEQVYVSALTPGAYQIDVATADYSTPPSRFAIDSGLHMQCVYLGKSEWPTYNIGASVVPFEPFLNRLAIVFVAPVWRDKFDIKNYLAKLQQIGLVPLEADKSTLVSATRSQISKASSVLPGFIGAQGAIIFLKSASGKDVFSGNPAGDSVSETVQMFAEIRSLFPAKQFGKIRLGVPISTGEGRIKVIDHRFIVEFIPSLTSVQVDSIASKVGAVASVIPHFPGFHILTFTNETNYLANLKAIDVLIKNGDALSGEPDLIFDLADMGCTVPPTENWFACQDYVKRQKIDEAWKIPLSSQCGNDSITIATLDRGLNMEHADLNTGINLHCVDLEFAGLPDFPESLICERPLANGHGMHVYGVINAPHNGTGVAGIASDTRHVAIRRMETNSVASYAAMLKWVGGLGAPLTPAGEEIPNPPSIPPADIINCSHILKDLPTPTLIGSAFKALVSSGRSGAGCLIVYAAGQGSAPSEVEDVQGVHFAATSSCTVIVGNTADNKATNWTTGEIAPETKEVKDPTAYVGRRIDLCAFAGFTWPPDGTVNGITYSRGAPTLGMNNSAVNGLTCRSAPATGIWPQGLTSIAAAMVSGVAGLILSYDPTLKWHEVRSILQGSAEKVDSTCSDATGVWMKWTGTTWTTSQPPANETGLKYHSKWYGYGRLNAEAAVKMAMSGLVPVGVKQPQCCGIWEWLKWKFLLL